MNKIDKIIQETEMLQASHHEMNAESVGVEALSIKLRAMELMGVELTKASDWDDFLEDGHMPKDLQAAMSDLDDLLFCHNTTRFM